MEMLERDAEMDLLSSLLELAINGSGRVILVRGEAGIGKSTLVGAFTDTAAANARVLFGVCDDLKTPRELAPLWDISRESPELAEALEAGDLLRIYSVAVDLVCSTPTVAVFEDIQWADAATLDLIKVIGRRIDRGHGLLVLTYRDEDLDKDHRLRQVIGDLPPRCVERLILGPLSAGAVDQLAASNGLAGGQLMAVSGGNPFYLSELIASPGSSVPDSVDDAIRSRTGRLSAAARHLLELVSVVPGSARLLVVQAVEGWQDSLEETAQRGFLKSHGDRVSFRHELTRRAIAEALAPARRQQLHRAVLASLLDAHVVGTEALHHAVEAGDASVIVQLTPEAARRAMSVQSYTEALSHYRLLGPYLHQFEAVPRAELLEEWSYSASIERQAAEAQERANQAVAIRRETGDPAQLGRSLRWLSRTASNCGDREAAGQAATEAISVLEPLVP